MRGYGIEEIRISLSTQEAECLIACLKQMQVLIPDGGDEEDAYTRELVWHLDRKLRSALAGQAEDA